MIGTNDLVSDQDEATVFPTSVQGGCNALLILTEPPLPFGGAASRWNCLLVDQLLHRGFDVTLLCCSGGEQPDRDAMTLYGNKVDLHFFAPLHRRGIGRFATVLRPLSHQFSDTMRDRLYAFDLDEFDLIQFETHFAAWLVDRPIAGAVLNVHFLHAIDQQAPSLGPLDQIRLRWLLRTERKLLNRFAKLSVLTPRLAESAARIHPNAEIAVCPMSIDLERYRARHPDQRPPGPPRIGIIGSFHWGPTRSACQNLVDKIWPPVAKTLPNARLLIVGRNADQFCEPWAAIPNIEIHSDVDDTKPYFDQLDVLVYLPHAGSGMKVKVLEAIAMGTPVVTNAEGAEGLPGQMVDAIQFDTFDQSTHRVMEILRDPVAARRQAVCLRQVLDQELNAKSCVDRTLAFGLRDGRIDD